MTDKFGNPGAGKVIGLDRFRSGKSLSPIHQAEAYWAALCDGTDIPSRSQIDPRGLENILEYAFVLERIAPGIGRFRLAGQFLCQLAGTEVRGMPVTSFFTPSSRDSISATLEHVFDAPAVAELSLMGKSQRFHSSREAKMILLPLKSDLGDVSRVLGVLIADDGPGRQPHRFDVIETEFRDISAMHNAPVANVHPVAGFAEAQMVLGGKAPHLRLVKTDK